MKKPIPQFSVLGDIDDWTEWEVGGSEWPFDQPLHHKRKRARRRVKSGVPRKMKRLILSAVIAAVISAGTVRTGNAGAIRVASFPIRHPIRTLRKGEHVVFFPVFHPVKTSRAAWRVIW
jgi:hypothetical protein